MGRRAWMPVVGLALALAAVPGGALAVRPSVSASLVQYAGRDPEGPVFFSILSDNGIDQLSDMTFATECARSGRSVPGTIVVKQPGNRAVTFSYHRRGFSIRGRISGNGATVTGTVRLDTAGCDSDVLPFRARAQP